MFDIPVPPQPDIIDNIAIFWPIGLLVLGISLSLWGKVLSRPLMGIICAGFGVWISGPMVTWFPSLGQNLTLLKIASAAVLGAAGYLIAPIIFVMLAGLLSISIAWITSLTIFANSTGSQITLEDSAGLRQWATVVLAFYKDLNTQMLKDQAGQLLIVLLVAMIVPLIIGIWRSRFITILMTSIIGAVLAVATVMTWIVQSNSAVWPEKWSDFLLPLSIAAVMAAVAVVFQYVRLKVAKKKKQAKEQAKQQAKEQQKESAAGEE